MENVLVVAKTLYQEYFNKFHKKMDEMKMHKLMYFIQRESLMYNNDILFNEDFLGWKFGPVLLSIRNEYKKLYPFNDINGTVSDNAKKIIDSVLTRYGSLSSWKDKDDYSERGRLFKQGRVQRTNSHEGLIDEVGCTRQCGIPRLSRNTHVTVDS